MRQITIRIEDGAWADIKSHTESSVLMGKKDSLLNFVRLIVWGIEQNEKDETELPLTIRTIEEGQRAGGN